jgi:site-specific recombinase XerD
MTSMTHLYASAPAPVVGIPRKPHNTNRGLRFPPDPIRTEEFAILLAHCRPLRPGRESELSALRLRTLLVILYRTGLRISEALDLYEFDLRRNERAIVVRRGKGDKRRIVLVDEWGWRELEFWLTVRSEIAPGALLPVIRGQLAGRPMTAPDARRQMARLRERAGLRRRVHPHAFRHGFAVDSSREGIPLYTLQGQLGHARLDVTERYLRGIDPMERLAPIAARRPPTTVIPSVACRRTTSESG